LPSGISVPLRPIPGGFTRKILYGTFEIVERTSTRDSHGASRIVSDACEYIRARATDASLDLEDIAEHVHVSPRILQLRFAEVLGHSVIAEVSAVKLAKVKDMLEMSDLPIATVAEQCGYTPHHLANFFKRKFGCSMSDWRRRQIETVSACS